jgi:hypothetical protein
LAERIDVSEPVEPGDVVEIDPDHPKRYRKARTPYSPLIAGVIASIPGIILANLPEELNLISRWREFKTLKMLPLRSEIRLREPSVSVAGLVHNTKGEVRVSLDALDEWRPLHRSRGRPLLALMGQVHVKATTENGPIRSGDLLVSSSTPGYVMRCPDPEECVDAIVGKAIESLEEDTGLILMLIMR